MRTNLIYHDFHDCWIQVANLRYGAILSPPKLSKIHQFMLEIKFEITILHQMKLRFKFELRLEMRVLSKWR